MNEGIYTRDTGRSKKKIDPEKTTKKTHAGKLKNEASRAEYARRKLRIGKADITMTKEEKEELRRLRKQGRRKIYADAAVSRSIHSEISSHNEDNNAGVDAVNAGTEVAGDIGYGIRGRLDISQKEKEYQAKLKENNEKLKESGSKTENGYSKKIHGRTGKEEVRTSSKEAQKNLMRKEIQRHAHEVQAKESANAFGSITKRFTDKAEDIAGRLAEMIKEFAENHPLGLLIAVLILIVILVLSGTLSSCSMMAGGGNDLVVGTSYTADNADILAVEADYQDLEADLQEQIDNIETDYPDYDEYNYELTEIGHDPFELAALLTVLYEDYTEEEVQEMLQTIFEYQYTLEIEEEVETREREVERSGIRWVEDDSYEDGGYWEPYTYTETEEYEYYILNVTLTNEGIQAAVDALDLTVDQIKRYEVIVELKGNKPDIFGETPYINPGGSDDEDYAVPSEYLTDAQFARMLAEAERYLGYPYVWGGSNPSTSFDCSGYVSWVINHCGNGWNYGRLTANGWKNATARVRESDVKPGDLIFFQGTYNTVGASHVGIVVDPVNKIMIHCGSPIKYASYDTRYWRVHFYCYGRIR
jgi:cell wall-associated NlpC family hydrolase